MFESAEIGHSIPKARYKREEPKLREALLDAQFRLLQKPDFPVLILVGGVDGAGRSTSGGVNSTGVDGAGRGASGGVDGAGVRGPATGGCTANNRRPRRQRP